MQATYKVLVLYDGECGLCDHTVQWLLDHDKKAALSYAPLQGETAAEIMSRHQLPEGLDSIIAVRGLGADEKLFWYSSAAIEIAKELHWPWKILTLSSWTPAFVRDALYRLIARNRLRFFGKVDACRLPSVEMQQRFLP